jgi:cysteinyl-tRNA synthetase
MLANTRDLDGQSDKRNSQDFALWKKLNRMAFAMERWISRMAPRVYCHESLNI